MENHWIHHRPLKQVLGFLKARIKLLILVAWFCLAWSWTLATDSLELAGSQTQGLLFAILIIIVSVSISTLLLGLALSYIDKLFTKYSWIKASLMSLSVLALIDFMVSWLVALLGIGPEGSYDNVLPLSSPALILINTPLGFASRLIGFYGLAAFAWLSFYLAFSKNRRRLVAAPLLTLAVLSAIGYQAYKTTNGAEVKSLIISESIAQRLPPVAVDDARLIVFPEYGLDKITMDNINDRLISEGNKHYFVGSEQVLLEHRTGHYNRLIFGNTLDGFTNKQDKFRLIPFGETLPYFARVGLRAAGQHKNLEYFDFARGTIKGTSQLEVLRLDDGTVLGSAVCSSVIAPQDYRHFARQGATIFTNSASLGIFQGSSILTFEQKSLARFMAIANSRYYLQSSNGAKAYAYNNNGQIIAEADDLRYQALTARNNSKITLYAYLGEWMVYAGIAVLVCVTVSAKYHNKSSRKAKPKT